MFKKIKKKLDLILANQDRIERKLDWNNQAKYKTMDKETRTTHPSTPPPPPPKP